MFSSETYSQRRKTLLESLRAQDQRGLLLFLGNEESAMNYADNGYTFRQDSCFLYYFGQDQPGFAALIDLDEGGTTLFADDLTIDAVVWMGPQPSVAEQAARSGVTATAPASALADVLSAARNQRRSIHTLPPYRPEHELKRLHLLEFAPGDSTASVPFIRAVVEQRAIKSEEEVAQIEAAVETSLAMHKAALAMARPGMKEADLAAKVTEIALAAGGGLSFPVIATIRGETLHNHYHGHTIQDGDLFLLDCGAENALHYAGDLTSTFPVGRRFTPRQKDVYDLVLAAHLAVVASLKPGVPFKDMHLLACRTLVEGLKGLGLMKGDPHEAVAAGAHAMFFQCGPGACPKTPVCRDDASRDAPQGGARGAMWFIVQGPRRRGAPGWHRPSGLGRRAASRCVRLGSHRTTMLTSPSLRATARRSQRGARGFWDRLQGHMMGLDVHDMENLGEVWVGYEGQPKSTQFGLKSLRLARPLQPGFVHTVEPGLYFIPTLIDQWRAAGLHQDFIDYGRVESFRDFGGVRIEEDFLITADGARRLGGPRPLTSLEVEALRA